MSSLGRPVGHCPRSSFLRGVLSRAVSPSGIRKTFLPSSFWMRSCRRIRKHCWRNLRPPSLMQSRRRSPGGDAGIKAPPASAFGVEEKDRAWVDSKTTPHPVGTYTEKAVFTGAREKIGKKMYVRAKGYKSPTFDANLARVKARVIGKPSSSRSVTTSWSSIRRRSARFFCP